jgi:predicted O-methyltransferase YrrM
VSEQTWSAVDRYVSEALLEPDPELDAALQASAAAGLPPISVTPSQGKLLELLARSIGARAILEVGTLGAYSTIWLARSLPVGGRLVTLEANPSYAEVASSNIAHAGLSDVVELRVGPALETLPRLAAERGEPFDLVFIDADKRHTPEYFTWALELTRPGSLIVADNVIRDGAVIDADSEDPVVLGSRRLHELLTPQHSVGERRRPTDRRSASGPVEIGRRVSATTIQTVGAKGYDGFTLALVLDIDR